MMLKSQACADLRKESQCRVSAGICVRSCGHLGRYTDCLHRLMKGVLIFLGYVSIPWNGSRQDCLSVLVSDSHRSFILWGMSSVAVNTVIVISYVFQVFL